MPSPGEDIQSWSTVAANNGTADPLIVWSEGQARASVNNSSRSEMAAIAKWRNLLNGSIVTTGTANAQQFLSGVNYTSIPSGLRATLKVGGGLTNDASITLNMDGLGDVLVKTAADGLNLKGGEFVAGGYVDLLYNGTNWIFLYGREFFFDAMTGGGGIIIGKQIFNAAGTFTYTPTFGMEACILECIGGGGAGGGHAIGVGNQFLCSPGGGSGGYSRKYANAIDIGLSQTVTVGAGGAPVSGTGGGNGGVTSVGTLCIANGGFGGTGGGAIDGAAGAAIGTGDCCTGGTSGGPGFYNNDISAESRLFVHTGNGAPGPFGGGVAPHVATSGGNLYQGISGNGYGSGGSGGVTLGNSSATQGGPGTAGVVIITEFAGRGTPGHNGVDGPPGPVGPPGPAGAGTGDVLVQGTPVAGQIARWFDTSHIEGIDPGIVGFTTGDAKLTLKTVADAGWVLMNDGTIGSTTSGASTRANFDTQALFTLLFNNITDAWAPILTSAGAATTRALQANAATAWAANCRMTLTRQLGRSLSIAGAGAGLTARVLGQYDGSETHVQTATEMAPHTHSISGNMYGTPAGIANGSVMGGGTGDSGFFAASLYTSSAGSGSPMDIMNPRSYWNIMIKL
jgi:hypothetical protein